ncbi:MAG TPA: hypothetical protein VNK95_13170 [Caldilineaceae bacterium]|nr:hypothetical protein [Caldilineaceae bacterium]
MVKTKGRLGQGSGGSERAVAAAAAAFTNGSRSPWEATVKAGCV